MVEYKDLFDFEEKRKIVYEETVYTKWGEGEAIIRHFENGEVELEFGSYNASETFSAEETTKIYNAIAWKKTEPKDYITDPRYYKVVEEDNQE